MANASTLTKPRHTTQSIPLAKLPRPDRRLHGSRVKSVHGVIKTVKHLTYDTIELVVKADDGQEPLNLRAGQYVTLQTEGLKKPRSYSLANAPSKEAPNEYTFYVRLVHGGEFTGWLFERNRTGSPISLSGPMGKFGLDNSSETIVAIAGGSGMSVIKALLDDAATRKVERNCLFMYGARTQRDLYCQEEIEAIKKNWHPDYSFESVMVLSEEPAGSSWHGATGFVCDYFDSHYIKAGKIDVTKAKAFFCGPPPMVDHGVKVLTEKGMARHNIFFDKFEDAKSPAPVINNQQCFLCDECLLVKPRDNCIVEVSTLKKNGSANIKGYEKIDPAYTSGLYYNTLFIDESECIRCYACVDACPAGAISPDFDKMPRTLRMTIE